MNQQLDKEERLALEDEIPAGRFGLPKMAQLSITCHGRRLLASICRPVDGVLVMFK